MKAVLGTRKGILIFNDHSNDWNLEKIHFNGVNSPYAVFDHNSGKIWAGLNHGHWGPKVHSSVDDGITFKEHPVPKFPKEGALKEIWNVVSDSQGRLYLGSAPAALFWSDDQGESWQINENFEKIQGKDQWFGGGTESTCLHSILIDPRDENHLSVGISCAGYIHSFDRGETWSYSNTGMKAYFLPDPDADIGQDPHLVVRAPSDPDVLWQQNHCGIFRSTDNGKTWDDLSQAKGLFSSFGWGVVVDELDPLVAYTVPALSDESRILKDGRLVVQKTTDGGESWQLKTGDLPQENCWDIVYRHALALKGANLMFGTTTGNLYSSNDGGESWRLISSHLPPIYSVSLF